MLGRLRGLVVWGWLLSVWVQAYNFPPGFVHRYTYVSVNNVMDHRNVTTVLKVLVAAVPRTRISKRDELYCSFSAYVKHKINAIVITTYD